MKKIVLATSLLLSVTSIVVANTASVKKEVNSKLISEDSIPLLTVYMTSKNWGDFLGGINKNIRTYDYYPVDSVDLYSMKDGVAQGSVESVNNLQIRLKGNTSRTCPETVYNDDGTKYCGHSTTKKHQFNQAHFQLKFKNPTTGEITPLDGYDKIHLKFTRGDGTHIREQLTSKYLRGVYKDNAQKEVQTKTGYIHFVLGIKGDPDPANAYLPTDKEVKCKVGYHCYDFGLYQSMETVNSKEYLDRVFGDDDGYLWKGTNQDASGDPNLYMFGNSSSTESTQFSLNWWKDQLSKSNKDNCSTADNCDTSLIMGIANETSDGKIRYKPSLSFKGDANSFGDAKQVLSAYMYYLNYLPSADLQKWIISGELPKDFDNPFDPNSQYNYKLDYKSFLEAMAFQYVSGDWDGYWGNSNNFLIYFDKEDKTLYFIPYDMDTNLGSIVSQPPFEAGKLVGTQSMYELSMGGDTHIAPLITRLLTIPLFKKLYTEYVTQDVKEFSQKNVDNGYKDVLGFYQLMCKNFAQTNGLDCQSVDVHDYLCNDAKISDDGNSYTCSNSSHLIMPNITTGNSTISEAAAYSKIAVDVPTFYSYPLYSMFSGAAFNGQSEKHSVNYFLTNIKYGTAITSQK